MDSQPTSDPPRPHDSTLLKIIHWDKLFESDTPPRLGIEVGKRLPYTTMSAFSVGMAMGSSYGSKKAAYRFRAENAHRFPTTSSAWFQYHKSKNYTAIVGGVKEGMRMGFKLGAGAFAFCLFEETVDYARHDQRDFLSTVTAGLSFSGIYSLLGMNPFSFLPFWGILVWQEAYIVCVSSSTWRLHSCPHNKAWVKTKSYIRIDTRCTGVYERESAIICWLFAGKSPF